MNLTVLKVAYRDLRRGHRGFWIFLSCLALGVAAITAVMTMSASLVNGIERDGRILLGGEIAIGQQFHDLTDEQLLEIQQYSESSTRFLEMRTLLRSDDVRRSGLISLKAIDDNYPVYGEFVVRDGGNISELIAWNGETWGAIVDPVLIESGRVSVGEQVFLGNAIFTVTAVIENEPDRIGSTGSFGFWPRVIVSDEAVKAAGLVVEGSRTYFDYRIKLKQGVDPRELKTRWSEQYPNLDVRDYSNASPNLAEVIERIGVLLALAGLTTLLIGGVGVSNAIRAYMDTRLSTIAILKCVGASQRLVFRIYLTQILLLSGVGIALGMTFGTALSLVSGTIIANLYSVPIAYSFSLYIAMIIITYGMLTAILFTLWPLACALNTMPSALFRNAATAERRTASWIYGVISALLAVVLAGIVITTAYETRFAVWFVICVSVAWAAFRLVGLIITVMSRKFGFRHLPALRLAIANLHRPGAATSDIVLAIGLGLSVLVATAMVSANMDEQINNLIPDNAPTFFFLGIQSEQLNEFENLIEAADGTSDLNILPYIPGRITQIKGMNPLDALVDEDSRWLVDDDGERIFSYTAVPLEGGEMIKGDWWSPEYSGPPLLSIHKDVAEGFDVDIGDTITMNILGREITGTVHNIRDLEWRSMRLNFAIMLSPHPLNTIPHSNVGTVRAPPEVDFVLQEHVASSYANITVIRIKDALDRVANLMAQARTVAGSISTVTVLAGILVLAGIVISENRRRAYESVLLKTIGASRKYVLAAFSFEYLLQGVITAVVAIIFGTAASWAVVSGLMGWDWQLIPLPALNTAILGLAISLVLGMFGILRALRQRPLTYLRNG
ncbi:MAG: FtsX-like permease family protein [Acidiferrobacterales bacterium]|nr:FtsX-like permease family protein [Acidiferrobacterales bacterium]